MYYIVSQQSRAEWGVLFIPGEEIVDYNFFVMILLDTDKLLTRFSIYDLRMRTSM